MRLHRLATSVSLLALAGCAPPSSDDVVGGDEEGSEGGVGSRDRSDAAARMAGGYTAPAWTATGPDFVEALGESVDAAGDVNGDGFADLVVGAGGDHATRGLAFVYAGSATGLEASPMATLQGEGASQSFGAAVAGVGDVDGDGYDDVAVGEPGGLGWPGGVYVYAGGPDGVSTTPLVALEGEAVGDRFGAALAGAGDVDGDGYDDLLVGAPGHAVETGRAYVFHGGEAGPEPSRRTVLDGEPAFRARFGVAVAGGGDVDGDGYDDVVVGEQRSGGAVRVYAGGAAGPSVSPVWELTSTDTFGASPSLAGDVDGDGYDDLAVGTYDPSTGRDGTVRVYAGSAAGLATSETATLTGESGSRTGFGYSLTTRGDLDGDGYDDLVVGCEHPDDDGVRVFRGGAGGVSSTAAAVLVESAGGYGRAVSLLGDLDGDGRGDLAVGAGWAVPSRDLVALGRVYLYDGIGAAAERVLEGSTPELLGSALARAGDVDGDGYDDFLVAASDYGYDRGRVSLYTGGPDGPSDEPRAVWAGEEPATLFGVALAGGGDNDGDGLDDFVVGAPGENRSDGAAYWFAGARDASSVAASLRIAPPAGAELLGWPVAGGGDANGDGYDDLVISAWRYRAPNPVYLYLGGPGGPAGTPATTFTGVVADESLGTSVAIGGDLDGDGYDDVVVGERDRDSNDGYAHVYLGSLTGPSSAPSVSLVQVGTDSWSPYVAHVGDVDGDGYGDLTVADPGFHGSRGRVTWYRGDAAGVDAVAAWTAVGDADGDAFGAGVAGAGDLNGDGYAELVIGAPQWAGGPGEATLYFGAAAGPSDGNATRLTGESEASQYGSAVALAGDVDADGLTDLLVSAWLDALPVGAGGAPGRVYLYGGIAQDHDGDGYPEDVDCDDRRPAVHPGAFETCDGVDQDCDGVVDGGAIGATLWYRDVDGDGYGRAAAVRRACDPPAGYVGNATDCDDHHADVHPGAPDPAADGIDQDCDGSGARGGP